MVPVKGSTIFKKIEKMVPIKGSTILKKIWEMVPIKGSGILKEIWKLVPIKDLLIFIYFMLTMLCVLLLYYVILENLLHSHCLKFIIRLGTFHTKNFGFAKEYHRTGDK